MDDGQPSNASHRAALFLNAIAGAQGEMAQQQVDILNREGA